MAATKGEPNPNGSSIPRPNVHSHLTRALVCGVMARLSQIIHDVPFAIAGRSALSYYGSTSIPVPHVTILCPFPSAKVILTWVRAQGLQRIPHEPTGFVVPTDLGNLGARVFVRGTSEDFRRMAPIKDSQYGVSVVTLASLADRIAKMYIRVFRNRQGGQLREETIRQDMAWTLCRIVELNVTVHQFPPNNPPRHIENPEFWVPFSARFPDMVPLFQKLGLHIDRDIDCKPPPYGRPISPLPDEYVRRVLPHWLARMSVGSFHDVENIGDLALMPM